MQLPVFIYGGSVERFKEAQRILGLADFCASRGKIEKLISCVRLAVSTLPGEPKLFNRCGMIFFSLSMYEQAVECFDKAVKLAPKSFRLRVHRALSYAYLSDFERASEEMDDALSLAPGMKEKASCLHQRGTIEMMAEDYYQALWYFSGASALSPGNKKYRKTVELTRAFIKQQKEKEQVIILATA